MTRAKVAVLAAVLISLVPPACARTPVTAQAPRSGARSAPETLPVSVSARSVAAPALPYRQWRLPGVFLVSGYTGKRALLVRNTYKQDSDAELHLLDLSTGRTRLLVGRPLDNALGLQFLGCELSDDVVAWEECSRYDLENPAGTSWRLYACRYSAGKLVGRPALLDRSDRGAKRRPLFAVVGDTVVWMTGVQVIGDIGRVRTTNTSVYAQAIPGGRKREVLTTDTPLWTMAVDGERLWVAERDSKAQICTVRTGAWTSPKWEPAVTTLPVAVPSHSPMLRQDTMAFAAMTSADAGEADLFLRSGEGRITRLADRANNAVFAGGFLFWSATELGESGQYAGVYGTRVGTGECFTVVREDALGDRWRTLVRQPYLPHTLVISTNRFGVGKDKHDETLVRVYRL